MMPPPIADFSRSPSTSAAAAARQALTATADAACRVFACASFGLRAAASAAALVCFAIFAITALQPPCRSYAAVFSYAARQRCRRRFALPIIFQRFFAASALPPAAVFAASAAIFFAYFLRGSRRHYAASAAVTPAMMPPPIPPAKRLSPDFASFADFRRRFFFAAASADFFRFLRDADAFAS